MAVAAAVAGGGGGSAHQQRQADNKNRQIAACETGRAAGGDRSPYFGYASTLPGLLSALVFLCFSCHLQARSACRLNSFLPPVAAMIPT